METREPLAELAAIVREINEVARDRGRLSSLLKLAGESGIFQSAATFVNSHKEKPFVLCDVRGGDHQDVRGWQTWPFRRLFATMRPRCIAHPERAISALAIPFEFGDEWCVVLMTLSEFAYGAEFESFFEALANFTVPRKAPVVALPDGIPVSPVEPRIVSFQMCPSLEIAVQSMLARRAWSSASSPDYAGLRAAIESNAPDVIFVDVEHAADPFSTIMRLHTMLATETQLIAFGQHKGAYLERQGLVDYMLPHDAPETEIFALLKRSVQRLPQLRKSRLREMTLGIEAALRDSRTPSELSAAGARHASELMSGWAGLHLVSANGETFAAEYPRQKPPVLVTIPKTFLSDEPLFQIRADERFYSEVSDDRRVAGALALLQPVSAASIPLRLGDLRLGTLVSVSRETPADSSIFEALEGFAQVVARRFERLSGAARLGPNFERVGVWEYVRHGGIEFAVYRSRSCDVVWDYRAVRPDLGILTVGEAIDEATVESCLSSRSRALEGRLAEIVERLPAQRRLFLAICNPIAATIAYATRGFPVPLLFDAAGPVGAVSTKGATVRGTVSIDAPAALLIWDPALRRYLTREGVEVASITEALEDLRPAGIGIVVTSSGGGVRSSDPAGKDSF
jgi:hypothetical protein